MCRGTLYIYFLSVSISDPSLSLYISPFFSFSLELCFEYWQRNASCVGSLWKTLKNNSIWFYVCLVSNILLSLCRFDWICWLQWNVGNVVHQLGSSFGSVLGLSFKTRALVPIFMCLCPFLFFAVLLRSYQLVYGSHAFQFHFLTILA